MFIRMLSLSLLLVSACKTTPNRIDEPSRPPSTSAQASVASSSPEQVAAKASVEPAPLVVSLPVPPVPPSTQTPVESGFANVSFQDMGGFDAPLITITVPKDSTIRSNEFKVQYNACPQNPEATLPDELKACVQGYNRDLQFMIPVFTKSYSLKLQLCDEQKCYEEESTNIESTRPLSSTTAGPNDVQVALASLHVEKLTQDIFKQVAAVYIKLKDVVTFVDSCKTKLTASQISTLKLLAGLNQKTLENEFLGVELNNLEPLLSKDFKNEQETALNKVKSGLETFAGLFDNVFMLITAGVSIGIVLKDIHSLWQWRIEINAAHTGVKIGNKTVNLSYDSETGFLVESMCKPNCTYYVEDPDTKKPLFQTDGTPFTIDPKVEQIKYSNGRFYKYDYTKSTYFSVDSNGVEKPVPNKGFARAKAYFTTNYKEYTLLRRRDNSGLLVYEGVETGINKNNMDQFFNRKLNTPYAVSEDLKATYFRNRSSHYRDALTFKDIPDAIHSSIRPFIAVAIAGVSITTIAIEIAKSQKSDLELSSNTDICTTGVSLKNEMQLIAQDRTQIAVLNIQIASLQGHPVQVLPNSAMAPQ